MKLSDGADREDNWRGIMNYEIMEISEADFWMLSKDGK
jgi:hypothetical protein